MASRLLRLAVLLACYFQPAPSSKDCFLSRHLESKEKLSLTGFRMATHENTSVIQCANICFLKNYRKCWSFNYSPKARTCELNSKNERISPGSLMSTSGVRYYQTKWFSTEFFDGHGPSHCLNKGPCGNLVNFQDKVCYEINILRMKSWEGAKKQCNKKFGELAMFQTMDKWQRVADAMKLNKFNQSFYIGLNDLDNNKEWLWLDGTIQPSTPKGRKPWMELQPDSAHSAKHGMELCGALEPVKKGFLYNDVPCGLDWAYICQYDPWVYQNW